MTYNGKEQYELLASHEEKRADELTPMLAPYIDITDKLGALICGAVVALGKTAPSSELDSVSRDLIADVFDFLYETRPLLLKSKIEIAYPLARRAYESLSLLVSCNLDQNIVKKWGSGKEISNREVRKILGSNEKGENEESLRQLYKFFSTSTHPSRSVIPNRLLGIGNTFVLGAVGRPNLVLLSDFCLKLLDLWCWFVPFVLSTYIEVLKIHDKNALLAYPNISREAAAVYRWLTEQYNRVLIEHHQMIKNKLW